MVGVGLRVWQYLADTSMWFDELSIARNLSERSLGELLRQPLGYTQTAPLGFLAAVKLSSMLLGPSDMALRLFPFLCGIAGLFLFRRVAVRVLDGVAAPLAVALFALAIPLIRYSTELKQYGGDVVATLALTLVALDLSGAPPTVRRCIEAGAIGFALVWFSQAAVLVLAGLGAALLLRWVRERDSDARRPVLITLPIWALSASLGLVVARYYMTAETVAFMYRFWRSRQGFLPLPPGAMASVLWARDRIVQFFDVMSRYPWPSAYAALAVAGVVVFGGARTSGRSCSGRCW